MTIKLARREFLRAGLMSAAAIAAGPKLMGSMAYAAEAPDYLTLVGGGQGGAWYLGAATMAEIAKDLWPNVSTTVTPGGSLANLQGVGRRKIDIAYSFAMDVTAAQHGNLAFEGRPIKDLRAIMSTNAAYLSTVAKPEIQSYSDLAGTSAAPGRAGMTGLATFRNVVEEVGVADQVKEVNTDYPEMSGLFKDGVVSSATVIGSIPHSTINEILSTSEGHLLGMDDALVERLSEKYNYERMVIPAGTFVGQNEDVVTAGSVTQVVTHAEVTEEWIYKLTKATWENRQRLIQAHPSYKELTEEMALTGIRIPLHPGAEQYWHEIGLLNS
ncbi:TAXI family TRAP transporter solute-binding subunit [Halomonas kalidii]|uniref:TAXI family TRAP transporter solute-binding subunit n=1 Tax=Halomonas kalidii TaxID=3043293 RepID=A0ABT6VQQ9_9GAMM|nr:TAXI family TRAP transporter solute-binding subunit [Halomonas kalidii]MDI5936330.1 TAXI family TRAP transporter solute-binding subunit [Halomonas kalidii]